MSSITIKQNDKGRKILDTLSFDDDAIDLTGCTVKLFIRNAETLEVIEVSATNRQKVITLLTSDGAEATARASSHGLASGDAVEISGASGVLYNGTHVAVIDDGDEFHYQLSATGTDGTIAPDVDFIYLNRGAVGYELLADDTAVAGTFFLEWEVTFPTANIISIPDNGYHTLTINRDLG